VPASAGSFYSTYRLDLSLLDQDIAAAKQQLADLQQAAARPVPIGAAGGAAGGANAPDQAQASNYAQLTRAQAALEAQQARLARAQGDGARAAELEAAAQDRLTAALVRTDISESQSIALQRQLTSVQSQMTQAAQGGSGALNQLGGVLGQLGGQIGGVTGQVGALAGSLGTLGAVGAAAGLGKVTIDLAEQGAQATRTRGAFDSLARTAHTTGDTLLSALHNASHGEVSDLNLELAANRAELLGVAHDAETFSRLMEVARSRAQQMGSTTQQAFDDIVTGVGRASPRILDNLGIIISEKEAYDAYAASVGKSSDALTEAEKKQAILNAVLQQGEATMHAAGGAADDAASSFARAQASIDNAKNALGGLISVKIAPFAEDLSKVANAAAGIGSVGQGLSGIGDAVVRINPVITSVDRLRAGISSLTGARLPDFSAQLGGSVASWEAFIGALREGKGVTEAYSEAGRANAAVLFGQSTVTRQVTQDELAHADATLASAAAQRDHGQADIIAAQSTREYVAALEEDAAKSQIASVQSQTLAVAKQSLSQQAMFAANAMIASGQSGEAAAARLATSSRLVDQLTAAYLRLAAAQGVATQQALNRQSARQLIGADSEEAEVRNFRRSTTRDELARERKAYQDNAKAVADAKRDQVLAVGSANQQIKQREADLAEAERVYGEGSAQAIRAQTALEQEQDRQSHARGRAAGATKLTDQQKLHNTLLADEEKYQNKMQDLEDEHYKKLLDIQRDYDRKSLEEQHRNEVAKRQSRADFYDNLTQSTKVLGQKETQALSAEYEQAYAKAQQIAQAGDQKLAAEYLAMRQRQIQEEAEYQKQLAQARKDKDKDEIARLQQIHQLRQDANAEEEKQLLAGGDANAKQRDEQLAAEDARYNEQVDKATTAANRSADAKEAAAIRAGKAVDVENAKLQHQADLYDRIGTRAGGGSAGTTAGAAGDQGATSGGAALMRVFDSAVVDAINAQTTALSGGLSEVRDAVNALGPRIQAVESAVNNLQGRFAQ